MFFQRPDGKEGSTRTAAPSMGCEQGQGQHWADGVRAPEVQVLHGARGDEGLLRVVQHIGLRVHARLVVGHIHACAAQGSKFQMRSLVGFKPVFTCY